MKKTKHEYAGPWIRLLARSLDFLLISLFSLAFCLLVFINSEFSIQDLFKSWDNTSLMPHFDGWRVLLMTLIIFIFTFLYFCVLPCFWKGYTIFKRIFKIRIYTKQTNKNFFWLLIKHDFLIWFFILFFSVVMGIIATATNDPIELIKAIFDFSGNEQTTNKQQLFFALGTFLKTMFAFSGMIPAVLFFYMMFHKKKLALQDIVSETFVYSTNEYKEKTLKNNNENTNAIAPGINDNILINSNFDENYWSELEKKSLINNIEEKRKKFIDDVSENN